MTEMLTQTMIIDQGKLCCNTRRTSFYFFNILLAGSCQLGDSCDVRDKLMRDHYPPGKTNLKFNTSELNLPQNHSLANYNYLSKKP